MKRPILSDICCVGLPISFRYIVVSCKWAIPLSMYLEVSSTTIQLPLSAFLVVRSLFLFSELRLSSSCRERLGCVCGMGREESAAVVRDMYFSRLGLEEVGGLQSDCPLNGCLSGGGGGILPKKCLTQRDLENLSKSDSKLSEVGGLGVGTKLRPLDRTRSEGGVRVWLLRLIMYLLLTLLAMELSDLK